MKTDKKAVESSYIIAFYQSVGTLNSLYAQYYNLLLELEFKYTSKITNDKALSFNEADTKVFNQTLQTLRMTVMQTYIQYKSILSTTETSQNSESTESSKDLDNKYETISTKYIIDRDTIKSYVLELNKFLVKDIMQDLFDKSQDLLNTIYGNRNE